MARQQSTHMDAIRINKKLEEVIRKLADGRCEYIDPNITDQTVAAQLKVGPGTVASIRKQAFGQLNTPRSNFITRIDELGARVVTLEEENEAQNRVIDNQSRALAELIQKHSTLCNTLSLNKVADVRHLAITLQGAQAAHAH